MRRANSISARPAPYFIDFSALYRRAEAISHAYEGGNLVFFLGAGTSIAYQSTFPTWSQLLQTVLGESQIASEDSAEISSLITNKKYLLAAQALKQFTVVDRDDRDEAMDSKVCGILDREIQKGGIQSYTWVCLILAHQ